MGRMFCCCVFSQPHLPQVASGTSQVLAQAFQAPQHEGRTHLTDPPLPTCSLASSMDLIFGLK